METDKLMNTEFNLCRKVAIVCLSIMISARTNLNVHPVEPDTVVAGRQYSLPKPFIYVKPKPDGTMHSTGSSLGYGSRPRPQRTRISPGRRGER